MGGQGVHVLLRGAARNRSFTVDRKGQKGKAKAKGKPEGRKVGRLMPGPTRYRAKTVGMRRARGQSARPRVAKADGALSRIGRVRLVVSG